MGACFSQSCSGSASPRRGSAGSLDCAQLEALALQTAAQLSALRAAGGLAERSSSLGPGKFPGRPRRIILVRHGQSLGNVDEATYSHTPDWRVPLTADGKDQARLAGARLRKLLDADETFGPVFIYSSPYKRCQQTVEGLLQGAGLADDQVLGHRVEPRIREQDFGNFQDTSAMRACKRVRARFGRFFYRFPNGESGADVYDRVSTWLETLYRDMEYGLVTRDSNVVLVTHGLTARLFLMRWYHWSVETFERSANPANADLLVMERTTADGDKGGTYALDEGTLATLNLDATPQCRLRPRPSFLSAEEACGEEDRCRTPSWPALAGLANDDSPVTSRATTRTRWATGNDA
ncbi:histidine phosphatase superfamily [Pelagophyceae sp. CCMP2097]|nr:histidine phosphatase superfamily [Pelagophyceae sp. CCMP2097]